ncbi:MAG: type II toxin-antitoxin system mRNA interferase toxin, RelE/StbE family [Pseudobdellovibrio sp.]
MIKNVIISRRAHKDLRKLPRFVVYKVQNWVKQVENLGLEKVKIIPGFHDEPLQGKRLGQRSIRLNRSYRLIYSIERDEIQALTVLEVINHEY